jgi:NADH-quinone oxidoreductase subunit A
MLSVYLPILAILVVAIVIASAVFTLGTVIGPKNPTPEKMLPFEAGSDSTGAQHVKLSIKFYLTAILFVVFDIEAVFLYPWSGLFRSLGWLGLVEMTLFLTVLAATLVYAWKKGALEWEK